MITNYEISWRFFGLRKQVGLICTRNEFVAWAQNWTKDQYKRSQPMSYIHRIDDTKPWTLDNIEFRDYKRKPNPKGTKPILAKDLLKPKPPKEPKVKAIKKPSEPKPEPKTQTEWMLIRLQRSNPDSRLMTVDGWIKELKEAQTDTRQ